MGSTMATNVCVIGLGNHMVLSESLAANTGYPQWGVAWAWSGRGPERRAQLEPGFWRHRARLDREPSRVRQGPSGGIFFKTEMNVPGTMERQPRPGRSGRRSGHLHFRRAKLLVVSAGLRAVLRRSAHAVKKDS